MATRVIVGLIVLAAIVMAVAPDANAGGILSILLLLLGLGYGWVAIDAEDATAHLVVVLAVAAAAGANLFGAIPAVGMQLNAILGGIGTALYASVVTVIAVRLGNVLKG